MGLPNNAEKRNGQQTKPKPVKLALRVAMVFCVNSRFLTSITIDGIKCQKTIIEIMLKSMLTK